MEWNGSVRTLVYDASNLKATFAQSFYFLGRPLEGYANPAERYEEQRRGRPQTPPNSYAGTAFHSTHSFSKAPLGTNVRPYIEHHACTYSSVEPCLKSNELVRAERVSGRP